MTTQDVLALVKAGFTAEEIRILSGADAAPAAPAEPDPQPAAPAEPDPQPEPEEPQPAAPVPAPEPNPAAAPAWFTEFVQKNNEEMAAMQRALQITNVRRAAPADPQKTPEQLMAEAYRAIVE